MKNFQFGKSLALLALPALCVIPAVSCRAQGSNPDREWAIVQDLVGAIHGISTAPPADLLSSKYTSGALIGNGDICVVAGDTKVDRQSFHFGKSDFWGAGAHFADLPDIGTIRHNAPRRAIGDVAFPFCRWAR